MRTYEAIDSIGKKIVEEGLCEAILLKGSIGRGDDDAFSDVDMYLIIEESNREKVFERRRAYLEAYKDIVYLSEADFGLPQLVTIYEDGLHVDLYVATKEELPHTDPIKVYYDANGDFQEYIWEREAFSEEEAATYFEETLYYFVEADSAYRRKNYAWTARIMNESIACAAILLRYAYDKKFTFLGLKKINEILPGEQYLLLENAYKYLGKAEFQKMSACIMRALEIFMEQASETLRKKLNRKFYDWVRENLNRTLFQKEAEKEQDLLQALEHIHTTALGVERIRKNLSLNTDEVVAWCKEKITSPDAVISRQGKNWYIETTDCVLTVNAHSYTIITAHKKRQGNYGEV